LVLGIILGACGASGKRLRLAKQPYRNAQAGFSIRYPEGWDYQEYTTDVLFSQSGEMHFGTAPTLALVVFVGTIPQSHADGAETAVAFLEDTYGLTDEIGIEFGPIQEGRVGTEDGASVEVRAESDDGPIAGRLDCVHRGTFFVLIQAGGPVDDWQSFLPTYEAMLQSMTFFEPEGQPW
jgi:hypothetical protein